ncbi:hypothetical protein H112_00611 [Trichophyton rubrum D6]|uniref:Uncharacterized protein n=2 Tax=Trichophyton rubrum TaxID=5551 RepID=A0A080WRL0_TRIRC|nr:uncharacterized protein TERG_12662 [Trichophyton rubrum CBS 118892]EZF27518.1 hypothetical protein H100_00611 [Trichophyton rubrum MR850]EZF46456.1 hypothetical protein H102_00610 [Trichophyton rubrum CBS 100081]EZF57205.1 hypothetical protein H103_00612 [Trichophyton rubrum CBS 288.86]EZF67773.1 hypothetical protein H104_00599 [Trichophyton rubrum CBS 289.86]EZF89004.1 hypothetical protein H110_00616 [Trichophyton rubrum MR1448]EZF99800.1 hypothetical protein H113_00616 [Trichophyton rubr
MGDLRHLPLNLCQRPSHSDAGILSFSPNPCLPLLSYIFPNEEYLPDNSPTWGRESTGLLGWVISPLQHCPEIGTCACPVIVPKYGVRLSVDGILLVSPAKPG